jgi:hypothetical protein
MQQQWPCNEVEAVPGMVSSLEATSFVRLRPAEIMFTQAQIKGEFRDHRSLQQVAIQMACKDIGKQDIEMLKVVKNHDGKYYTLDNRRLAVFRLLALIGSAQKIRARVVSKLEAEWRRKEVSTNGGVSVKVLGQQRYVIGDTVQTTSFPIDSIANSLSQRPTSPTYAGTWRAGFGERAPGADFDVSYPPSANEIDIEVIKLMEAMDGIDSEDERVWC